MKTTMTLIAIGALLSACDRTPPPLPTPMLNTPGLTGLSPPLGPPNDPSLPPAESVFPPGSTASPNTSETETDGTREPKQAATGLLEPGQNNDHSAPLSTAK
ncbi:MAG: hypothetical protein U1D25_05760 [Hydrogenophaga sp.]|uniref:hypothetical protein n=1 Tax=Hydrogenophaga sp. TaxID=1904254 RepID=UPI002751383D|nr:hypothetical protein [Hydrogenophaga sp.]MDP2417542.1 hypothetical protein [Hydrogenophaga sp.]MDZ4187601.1 hypothetical protein [Hydrogenophaga sp.]